MADTKTKRCRMCGTERGLGFFRKNPYATNEVLETCMVCAPRPRLYNDIIVRESVDGKLCKRCLEWKPLDAFYKSNGNTRTGHTAECADCNNERHPKGTRNSYRASVDTQHIITKDGVDGKGCSSCGRWKPLHDFHRAACTTTGRKSHCATCCSKRDKRSRYRAAAKAQASPLLPRLEPKAPDKSVTPDVVADLHDIFLLCQEIIGKLAGIKDGAVG